MDYPKFCNACWKVEDCTQKQYMLAGTEPVTGYAVFNICDHVCEDCLRPNVDDYQEITDEELDGPAHCCNCGVPLKHKLTSYGIDYVKESIEFGDGCCRELWPTVWADYLDIGYCEFCEAQDEVLIAVLKADPDQKVCCTCHSDPRIPTIKTDR